MALSLCGNNEGIISLQKMWYWMLFQIFTHTHTQIGPGLYLTRLYGGYIYISSKLKFEKPHDSFNVMFLYLCWSSISDS